MSKITAIKPQKRQGRCNLFLDGKFTLGLSEMSLVSLGLKTGQELDDRDLSRIKQYAIEGQLLDRALRFLGFRPRSEKELRTYLAKKIDAYNTGSKSGPVAGDDELEVVIERLKEMRLLDDKAFALWWVEQRQSQGKPYGRRRIELELKQKGVSREVVGSLASTLGAGNELAAARKAVLKKLQLYKGLSSFERKSKLTAYLIRQGFVWNVISELFREPDFVDRTT